MLRRVVAVSCAIALSTSAFAVQADAIRYSRTKPAMGVSANSNAMYEDLNSESPMKVRRTYDGALPSSFAKSRAATDVSNKRSSYWSFKPNLRTFASDTGAQEAFSRFLDTIPQGHKATIILWHEPEDNIRAGEFSIQQWGASNTRAGQIIDSKKRPELRLGICLMGPWTFDSRSPYFSYDWEKAVDMRVVDVVGIDPYKFHTRSKSLEEILTVPNFGKGGKVPSTMDRLKKWNKPVAIMEWGVPTKDLDTGEPISDEVRGKWLADGYNWMKSWNAKYKVVKIEAAIWFHLNHHGRVYALSNEALDAFKKANADSRR